jgi:hypothetical protein
MTNLGGIRMKARVVTNKELKIAEEIAKQSEQAYMRRILKLVCYALHVQYGFGAKRISQIINFCNNEMKDVDETYWINLDRLLTEHIGIDFANEDYDEREARAKELKRKRK